MWSRRSFLRLSGLALAGALTKKAAAQPYPSRPIIIIVPFPAGSNVEVVVRFLADRLPARLGQPVVIENRPGAGGTIGAKAVALAEPDGHTLLFSTPGPLVVSAAVYKNPRYDPVKSFTPIASLFSSPQMLVTHAGVPASSIGELIAFAKANPGKVAYASPGHGTQPHLLGEMLRRISGADLLHIPYKGPAQAVTDLLAGEVQIFFETPALLLPHVQSGKLRALAIADERRLDALPSVPTTAESGYPTIQATFWSGILAPAGLVDQTRERLNREINALLDAKELLDSLNKLSAKPMIGSSATFAKFIETETTKWTQVVKQANIMIE